MLADTVVLLSRRESLGQRARRAGVESAILLVVILIALAVNSTSLAYAQISDLTEEYNCTLPPPPPYCAKNLDKASYKSSAFDLQVAYYCYTILQSFLSLPTTLERAIFVPKDPVLVEVLFSDALDAARRGFIHCATRIRRVGGGG